MVDVVRTVIRLGNFSDGIADIDPDGVGSAENAGALVNQTFTSTTMSIETVTYSDSSSINFDGANGGNTVTYDYGSGPVAEFIDQAVWYNITIVLADDSTINTSALIFQTPNGETFLTEFSSLSLDNLEIKSITPTSVLNNSFGSMATNNSVEGTTVCFGRGTQIMTPNGPRAVEDIMPGDAVLTTDGPAQKVFAVYRVPADPRGANPPIRFEPGSLGDNMPSKPLVVTGNHRMLCASRLVDPMFGSSEVLIPAKRFVGLIGVDIDPASAHLEFIHLELATHSVICANGALTESCLLGPVAVQGLPKIVRDIFLGRSAVSLRYPAPVGHKQRQFMRRLGKNGHPVIDRQACTHHFCGLDGRMPVSA